MIIRMLGNSPDHRRLRAAVLLGIAIAMLAWGWFDVRKRGRIDPEKPDAHRTDLTAYTYAGRAYLLGGDPYNSPNPRGWKYQYPPLLAVLISPIGLLEDTRDHAFIFFLISAALCFGVYDESRRWLAMLRRRNGDDGASNDASSDPALAKAERLISLLAGVAMFLPFLNTMQRGQVGILVVYPLMLGFRLVFQRGPWWHAILGGVALAFPAVMKVLPTLPAGFALILACVLAIPRRDTPSLRRAINACAGFAVGVALFLLVVPASVIGWQRNLDDLKRFADGVLFNPQFSHDWGFNIHSFRNQSLANAVYRLSHTIDGIADNDDSEDAPPPRTPSTSPTTTTASTPVPSLPGGRASAPSIADESPAIALATKLARNLILAAFLLVGVYMTFRGGVREAAVAFGLSCVAMLVYSPVSWGHHFSAMLPALLAVPLWLRLDGRRTAAAAMAIVPAVLLVVHYIFLTNFSGPLGLLGFGTTAWLLAAMALALRRREAKS